MDFEQLHTFKTVAKLNNYSKAARELNVTQPTVTTRINNLEQEVGCKLFDRAKRSISLTPEGELFLSYSNMMISNLKEAQDIIKQKKKPIIRIGVAPGFPQAIICRAIKEIDLKEVNIFLERGSDSSDLINQLLSDQLNLALISRPIHHAELYLEKLSSDQLVFAVSPNHRLAKFPKITIVDLHEETMITYDRKSLLWLDISSVLQNTQLNFIETKEHELRKELVKLGHGFALFSIHSLYKSDLEQLCIIPFKEINQIHKDIIVSYKKDFVNNKYLIPIISSIKNQLEVSSKG